MPANFSSKYQHLKIFHTACDIFICVSCQAANTTLCGLCYALGTPQRYITAHTPLWPWCGRGAGRGRPGRPIAPRVAAWSTSRSLAQDSTILTIACASPLLSPKKCAGVEGLPGIQALRLVDLNEAGDDASLTHNPHMRAQAGN